MMKPIRNKIHLLFGRGKQILPGLAVLAVLFGLVGFIVSDKTNGFLDVINNTIGIFAFNYPADNNIFLDIAKSLAIVTVFFGVLTLFYFRRINYWLVKSVQQHAYDLVIGLGGQNEALLSSRKGGEATLTIEAEGDNPSVESFRRKGFGVIASSADVALKSLKLTNLNRCIISTGNDRRNISLAMKLMDAVDEKHKGNIHVRVDNRDLSVLFKREVVSARQATSIDIVPFSLDELISKQLFAEHSVLGLQAGLICTDQSWSTIVIGASNLAAEIIYHLAAVAHLPEQNHLTIYCLHQNANQFCDGVEKRFPGIHQIPQLTLKAVELDSDSLSFYNDEIWQAENLTNIIVATDDEDKNLDIAVNLQDTTYIRETAAKGVFHTKVLFAMHSSVDLGEKINNNSKAFANFYSFGDLSYVATWENLIDEKLDAIAKLIHYEYLGKLGDGEGVDQNAIDQAWLKSASLNDRESCRGQAQHIDIKLLALGLKKQKSAQTVADLLLTNQKQLIEQLNDRTDIGETFAEYSSADFPDSFDSLFDKIARAEHNRWNAFHYLRGWKYDKSKNKEAKLHDCLLPLEQFETDSAKGTYQYDMQSILSIPKYLAYAGYEVVEIRRASKTRGLHIIQGHSIFGCTPGL